MGKSIRYEKVMEEQERRLHLQRCPLKELKKELRQANTQWLGTIDWDELELDR